ncbi:MAG: hypothetical protein NVS3B10_10510 [Polyangiales bacterium]
MLRFFFAICAFVIVLCAASSALCSSADKVAVLPFTAPSQTLPKPELEQLRGFTRDAVIAKGHALPSAAEMVSADVAVKDGTADTSSEYRAAGRAAGSAWTVTGHVDRHDSPPAKLPDGTEEEGYTSYRVELEVCQVDSGRVESLAREIDPDEAPTQLGEMLVLLLRPEGIKNAVLPWENAPPHKRKAKPKPAPPPPPPPPPPEPEAPVVKHAYAENRPVALGVSVGFSNALERPSEARGSSNALALGGVLAYAIEQAPGLELRGILTGQAIGPRALEISAGARYAIPILPQYRLFIGPEVLLGAHVAIGAEKTARFLSHGSAFAAWGITEAVQIELAGDLAAALGGSGTLILGGGTVRGLYRF